MAEFIQIALDEILVNLGEDKTKVILSSFLCPANKDIEEFIKFKAIDFSRKGLAKSHLVFVEDIGNPKLIGYYTLANKVIILKDSFLSKSLQNRVAKFAEFNESAKAYTLAAPLIAQLGKNFSNDYNKLITGDELLKLAEDKLKMLQEIAGGKVIYIECEEVPYILKFYSDNGFVKFGARKAEYRRDKDGQERYLVQMLKYIEKQY